ncbi:DUF1836 domain-containing protein [Bacillus gobiensis]|uniref:DUF1836 domain-containing protein n=1 Tax=Bacillus gobiensis TaxID=1441095 RepID=UPI003D24AB5D
MKLHKLNRMEMVKLLHSLKGEIDEKPLEIISKSERSKHDTVVPLFLMRYEKRKQKKDYGFSTNEIVELGNLCELTALKPSAIQNWIKRDIKDLIGHPELGKKYSVDQVVILLIVRDLKSIYDFDTIRNILKLLFNNIDDRSDDVVSPIDFYEGCARLLSIMLSEEKNYSLKDNEITIILKKEAEQLAGLFPHLNNEDWEMVKELTAATVLSILCFHLQVSAQSIVQHALSNRPM